MGAKRKPHGVSGRIHPAVIEAAGLDCDTPEERAWIDARYNAPLHPLPVYFAQCFDDWSRLSEEERERQIEIEERDPIGGMFTMAGAMMGDGILRCRERFAKACAAAVSVGDREFFSVFHDVYCGLGKGEFPVPFRAVVLKAWEFLTIHGETQEWDEGSHQWVKKRLIAGEFPTLTEIYDYIKKSKIHLGLWETDWRGATERILKKNGLKYVKIQRGGDHRSNRWKEK